MEKSEYDQKMKSLEDSHSQAVRKLRIEFVKANNPYKIGDIIENNFCRIKIEKIGVHISYLDSYPEPYYSGPKLKKNNVPFKNGEHETVYRDAHLLEDKG